MATKPTTRRGSGSGSSVELGLLMKKAGLSHFLKPLLERSITQVSEVKALADADLNEMGMKKGHGNIPKDMATRS